MKKTILSVAMLFALTTVGFGQSVANFNVSEKMVSDAQKGWCSALVQINGKLTADFCWSVGWS